MGQASQIQSENHYLNLFQAVYQNVLVTLHYREKTAKVNCWTLDY